jgi:large exoprotein involved in heme utilization and adhesion
LIDVADTIFLDQSGILSTTSSSFGRIISNAGNIEITTNNITLNNGSQINSGTFGEGSAGNVTVTATGNIFLDGVREDNVFEDDPFEFHSDLFSSISSQVGEFANGEGGNVNINAANLTITNGAAITASTQGDGNAGDIFVDVTDAILIDNSNISSTTNNITGFTPEGVTTNAGNIEISANTLNLTGGGQMLFLA